GLAALRRGGTARELLEVRRDIDRALARLLAAQAVIAEMERPDLELARTEILERDGGLEEPERTLEQLHHGELVERRVEIFAPRGGIVEDHALEVDDRRALGRRLQEVGLELPEAAREPDVR